MATLNAHLIMKNDSPQAWATNNPILMKGEVGCAIDSDNGIVTVKIGDGIHHWCDLEMKMGTRENSEKQAPAFPKDKKYIDYDGLKHYNNHIQNQISDLQEAMQKISKAASAAGVSMAEATSALANIYNQTQGNAESINTINTLDPTTQEPIIKMAQALKEEKQSRQKNPYLEDFEIPHYDFENMEIKNLIDF